MAYATEALGVERRHNIISTDGSAEGSVSAAADLSDGSLRDGVDVGISQTLFHLKCLCFGMVS